jgi:hypothetical protein
MGSARLKIASKDYGICGAAIVSELNLQGVMSHFIRVIDLNAFTPYVATMVEQQLFPGFAISKQGEDVVCFPCEGRQITASFKEHSDCVKFCNKIRGRDRSY